MAFSLGTIIYVALLLTNAIAILSEERFLAKSKSIRPQLLLDLEMSLNII
jgi:hypothetical protein